MPDDPMPGCMMPDGGKACPGYHRAIDERDKAIAELGVRAERNGELKARVAELEGC